MYPFFQNTAIQTETLFFSVMTSPSSKLRNTFTGVLSDSCRSLGNIDGQPFPCMSQYFYVEAILYCTEPSFMAFLYSEPVQRNSLSAHRNVLERIIDFCTLSTTLTELCHSHTCAVGNEPVPYLCIAVRRVMNMSVHQCPKLIVL